MVGIEKSLRQLTNEDIEIIALRWAREQKWLSNRNVNCFIAGLEMARQWMIDSFSEMLMEEGLFFQNEYSEKRIVDLSRSGIPLTPDHHKEFDAAQKVGELLLEASRIMYENKVLK